jgi:hypothetical protein
MKNIQLIQTDKPSRFSLNSSGKYHLTNQLHTNSPNFSNRCIHITSDEEDINENDYIITKDGRLVQVSYLLSEDLEGASKVIITNDQDLIKDGVQPIDDEFLEWFVKNPECEFVKVQTMYFDKVFYKIIIPKEEPKQETLEEAANNYYKQFDNLPVIRFNAFIAGAKWQAERMYSEEEVLKSFDNIGFKQITLEELNTQEYQPFITDEDGNIWVIDKEKWFEQFKKK